jgi:hypothetical protein
MRVLVIGGMHGNEPLGIELVDRLTNTPISGVKAVLANPAARQAGTRFTGSDLNRSFPGADDSYERIRAKELLQLCSQFDLVLDFHNTHCPNNDCVFIGSTARPLLEQVASFINLPRIIVADYECINKYAPNCMSVEISLDSPRNTVDEWFKILQTLAKADSLPQTKPLEKYRFVYRMTLEDKERLRLDDASLRAFKPIDDELALAMKVTSPAYPIFIDDAYTPYNYGGLLNKL